MIPNPIRYRFAKLLIWAAMALVMNPVLHSLSHNHLHFPEGDKECVSDIHWVEQELCPHCDAVSQFVEPHIIEASFVPVVLQEEIEAFGILCPDLRLRLSTRLRAPPSLV